MRAASFALTVLIGLTTAGTAGAADQLISAKDVSEVLNIARGQASATLATDSDGDPMIKCKFQGLTYSVMFYGCTKNVDCRSIQLRASFDPDAAVDAERIMAWNRKRRWLNATLDDKNSSIVTQDVLLDAGVTSGDLDKTFETWNDLLLEFAKHIGFR